MNFDNRLELLECMIHDWMKMIHNPDIWQMYKVYSDADRDMVDFLNQNLEKVQLQEPLIPFPE